MTAKRAILIILFVLPSVFNLKSQTIIQEGPVYGDWLLSGSPYLIQGDIQLPSDKKLRIWPGVQVIFQGQFGFELQGKLEATGTVTDSITFTLFDTTGYSQNNNLGWSGLYFNGSNYSYSDSSKLAFCNIEFSRLNGINCNNYSLLNIRDTEIRFNKGSGIYAGNFSDFLIERVIIRNNKSEGMAIFSSSPQVYNFVVKRNWGSGVSIIGNGPGNLFPLFSNGKISQNKSLTNGGGIYIGTDAFAYFENVVIQDNQAIDGGGIYCGMASCELKNIEITGNYASVKGGAVFGNSLGTIIIKSSLITKNIAGVSGGGLFVNNCNIHMSNCTVAGNAAGIAGSGFLFNCFFASVCTINNSIIYHNIGSEIEMTAESPVISYSDISGGFPGIGNIDMDPLFYDPLNNDYRLSWISFPEESLTKSPCIDAGDPNSILDPDGTLSDMGAYYFDQGIYTSVDKIYLSAVGVYPNPAHDFVKLANVSGFRKLAFTNLSGNIIINQEIISDTHEVDISGLNSGIYLIQLTSMDNDKSEIIKVIKK